VFAVRSVWTPTQIYGPYTCTYTIRNNSDDFGDTMRAFSVVEVVQSASGPPSSGNIFSSPKWVAVDGTATCTDGAGFGGTGPGSIRT